MSSTVRDYITEVLASQFSAANRNVEPQNVLRFDDPVRTQFWSLGAPIGAKPLRHAACAVVMDPRGKFLGVSRKYDPTDFGLPGGHVELGETPEVAAARELQEETGLSCKELRPLVTLRDGGVKVHVFTCVASGDIDTDEAGVVRWVGPQQLVRGTFGDQNRIILGMLGVKI